jgi:hypothetical protein
MAYVYDPTTGRAVLQQAPQQAPGALSGGGIPWGDMLTSVGSGLLSGGSLAQGLGQGAQNFLAQKVARERQAREDHWKQQVIDMDRARMAQDQEQFKLGQQHDLTRMDKGHGYAVEEAGLGQKFALEKLGAQNGYATEQANLDFQHRGSLQAQDNNAALQRLGAQTRAQQEQARLNADLGLRNDREGWAAREGQIRLASELEGGTGLPGTFAGSPRSVQAADYKMRLDDTKGYENSARLVDDIRTSKQNVANGATIGPDIFSKTQRAVTTFLGIGNVDLNTAEGQLAAQRQFESIPQGQGAWSNEERALFAKAIANPAALTKPEYLKLLDSMEKRELSKMSIMDEYNAMPADQRPLWAEHKTKAIGKQRRTVEGNPRSGEAQPGDGSSVRTTKSGVSWEIVE